MSIQSINGITKPQKVCCEFVWNIEDFLLLPYSNEDVISSAKFTIGGLSGEWNLDLDHTKDDNFTEDWIGLFINFTSPESVKYFVRYTFTILSSQNDKNIAKKSSFQISKTSTDYANNFGLPHFVHRKKLLSEGAIYLPGNTLTIMCSFEVVQQGEILSVISTDSHKSRSRKLSSPEFVTSQMQQLHSNNEFTDFELKVEGKAIAVNKFMLAAFSPVLKAMLQQDMLETKTSCLEIEDLSYSGVNKLVEFIYSGEIDVEDPQTAMEVFKAAHKYDVQKLQELCSDYLSGNITVGNVCDLLKFAELYKCDGLSKEAKKFVVINLAAVLKTEGWKAICDDRPKLAIELFQVIANFNSL